MAELESQPGNMRGKEECMKMHFFHPRTHFFYGAIPLVMNVLEALFAGASEVLSKDRPHSHRLAMLG